MPTKIEIKRIKPILPVKSFKDLTLLEVFKFKELGLGESDFFRIKVSKDSFVVVDKDGSGASSWLCPQYREVVLFKATLTIEEN